MYFTRKYNLVNNITGWAVFVIALVTYWLTLEPTVSFWDCGEFISQADKLEIGHPPGNPIFILAGRFFANFALGDASKVPLMINAMSGLLSALTILLLFWTITHLALRLLVDNTTEGLSRAKYLVIMGAGVVGALAYTWSDTFWFSAVEGEVYAFSSFCTALVFWLILKWENRADKPHSDRYLILIAYVIGVSIAVHLLNLLCIPAIVLVFTYRKWRDVSAGKSLLALLCGFAIIVFVLYGLVPGFINVAGWFELTSVNTFGLPYNSGTLIYVVLAVGSIVWSLAELYLQKSAMRTRISFCLGVFLSGMLFIGENVWIGLVLLAALIWLIFFKFGKKLPMRWLNVVMWSIGVIFVGYSSYALILIRSHANPPLNQSNPKNVFDLSSYLSREQYGETPLLYGSTYKSASKYDVKYVDTIVGGQAYSDPMYMPHVEKGKEMRYPVVKGAKIYSPYGFLSDSELAQNHELTERSGDCYVLADYKAEMPTQENMNMFLPRIHSQAKSHAALYESWVPSLADERHETVELMAYNIETGMEEPLIEQYYDENGEVKERVRTAVKPTIAENLEFFFGYQLNHMYWRYFLWNFVGRQNDYCNQNGEMDLGNWISGINAIDNARLGDQSLLPENLGSGNAGHNVFYFLPLILGIIGLLWQAFRGRRGIEQFWVVFFLFFMTGIAIVLYLNQPPGQPRERDYAFAGSFYAFAIWIGLGVPALWRIGLSLMRKYKESAAPKSTNATDSAAAQGNQLTTDNSKVAKNDTSLIMAVIACVIGIAVPLQMVSQTWDDHDRSGRYAALHYAKNYLESLEPNAIIFCNGDNDTFPLWYAQEVEGVRPDVKIVNLSYLQSDWYINQQRLATYKAPGIDITATPADIAYGRRDIVLAYAYEGTDVSTPMPLLEALKGVYATDRYHKDYGVAIAPYGNAYIEVDTVAAKKRGLADSSGLIPMVDRIPIDLAAKGQLTLSEIAMLDIIATNAKNGWERPIYWAGTVGSDMYDLVKPYLRSVGLCYQLVPYEANMRHDTERSYKVIKNKFLSGGADAAKSPYMDETAGRMLTFNRTTTFMLALDLLAEADAFAEKGNVDKAKTAYRRCIEMLDLGLKRYPARTYPLSYVEIMQCAQVYCQAATELGDKQALAKGLEVLAAGLKQYAANVKYVRSLIVQFGPGTIVSGGTEYSTPYAPAVALSSENSQILALYYDMMLLYNTYAGEGAAEKLLKSVGMPDTNFLREYYDMTHGNGGGSDEVDESSEADIILAYIMKLLPDILNMQEQSAIEYLSNDKTLCTQDSIMYYLIEMFGEADGDRNMLKEELRKEGLDLERSKRLYETYIANHPEFQ